MSIVYTPKQAISKAFLKIKPNREQINTFMSHFEELIKSINNEESEEHNKNIVSEFLKHTISSEDNYFINTKDRSDLVLHLGDNRNSPVGVIFEVKSPTNKSEMSSKDDLNKKSFQELLLYYFKDRLTAKNNQIRYLVITNCYEWFVFDAQLFEKLFYDDKTLKEQFVDFEEKRLSGKNTGHFYSEIAKPAIDKVIEKLDYTYFDIRDYKDNVSDNKIITLFKFFSPQHLLKQRLPNDSNQLNKQFYTELLHIIGLEEVADGAKRLIQRKSEGSRNEGSLLENTINSLKALDKIRDIEHSHLYGNTGDERLYNISLELVITWINRTLFLKLLEAQILKYNKGNKSFSFLDIQKVPDFNRYNSLFFEVLAVLPENRSGEIAMQFPFVPYLNSSLFEVITLERRGIVISNLHDKKTIPLISSTVLKDSTNNKRRTGSMTTLEYLFEFLDAYDFSDNGSDEIVDNNKTLINASVLGLIFEKINGYKDGSFFTPGFVTMYMCRETIRRAVLQKFNEIKGWNCTDFDSLFNLIEDKKEANSIVNSVKICDPAVGSGHFLVSALNEMLVIKSELKILLDNGGKTLRDYNIVIENDELIITDDDGNIFEYRPKNTESQRVQETIFNEKRTIIENCLFGVDINPNSVKICQLRLWIELLKNTFYKPDGQLETLPNIDINIKCGNSLISRYDIDTDIKDVLKQSGINIDAYRKSIMSYRNASSKDEKRELETVIADIKSKFQTILYVKDPRLQKLRAPQNELDKIRMQLDPALFLPALSAKDKSALSKRRKELETKIFKIQNEIKEVRDSKIYERAFEWRFEFPEVLNDDGDYVGFDVVIGNPPYIKEPENKSAFDGTRELPSYKGKMDIWYHFLYKAFRLTRKKGLVSFIATNNWVTNSGADNIRNIILDKAQIIELIDFGSFMVFDNASIQTMIMMFLNESTIKSYSFELSRLTDKKSTTEIVNNFLSSKVETSAEYLNPTIDREVLRDNTFTFSTNEHEELLQKIKQDKIFLTVDEVANGIHPHYDFVNKKIATLHNLKISEGIFGLTTQEKAALKLSPEELKLIKPYYTTDHIHRYYSDTSNSLWLIYTDSKFKEPSSMNQYPNLKQHLDRFATVITSDNKPYGLHRARNENFFRGEKIVVLRKCANKPSFSYSDFDCYVSATFYVIKTDRVNQKYLLGLLNSKLIEFWLRHKGKMQGSNFQLDSAPLCEIPICVPTNEAQIEVAKLIDRILEAKRLDLKADTSAFEAEIDRMVYALYNLTKEEIAIIKLNNL